MAMHLVNAESLIRDLWYQIFRSEEGGIPASQRQNLQYKRPGLALYFKMEIDLSNYGYEKEKEDAAERRAKAARTRAELLPKLLRERADLDAQIQRLTKGKKESK